MTLKLLVYMKDGRTCYMLTPEDLSVLAAAPNDVVARALSKSRTVERAYWNTVQQIWGVFHPCRLSFIGKASISHVEALESATADA